MPIKRTIKEIKEQLLEIDDPMDPFIQACLIDERKGVQTAIKQWQKQQDVKEALFEQFERMNQYELDARTKGYQVIAGIDEVGRGPLAGPVVAAAVVLDEQQAIIGLDDSKKLSLKKRTALFSEIKEKAIAIGIGIIDAQVIDQFNILEATKMAMQQAINQLNPPAEFLLIDAVDLPDERPSIIINQGDSKSNSIAAASIIAKVTRDLLMVEYDEKYPGYGFRNNAGYGTKEHLEGLKKQGATPIHRQSFTPVRELS